MPDPHKLMAYLTKLGFAALTLVVAGDLITQILTHLTFPGLMLGFIGLVLISPLAYFILQSAGPRSEQRARRGAERTPLLPPHEEE